MGMTFCIKKKKKKSQTGENEIKKNICPKKGRKSEDDSMKNFFLSYDDEVKGGRGGGNLLTLSKAWLAGS